MKKQFSALKSRYLVRIYITFHEIARTPDISLQCDVIGFVSFEDFTQPTLTEQKMVIYCENMIKKVELFLKIK